jgi:hypothetical protein
MYTYVKREQLSQSARFSSFALEDVPEDDRDL